MSNNPPDKWCDKCSHAEHAPDKCDQVDVDPDKDWATYRCKCNG